mgnify:CR=1 FL=1
MYRLDPEHGRLRHVAAAAPPGPQDHVRARPPRTYGMGRRVAGGASMEAALRVHPRSAQAAAGCPRPARHSGAPRGRHSARPRRTRVVVVVVVVNVAGGRRGQGGGGDWRYGGRRGHRRLRVLRVRRRLVLLRARSRLRRHGVHVVLSNGSSGGG